MGVQQVGPRWAAIAVLAVGGLSACTAENPSAAVSDPCQRRVDASALAIDVSETAELLDIAIEICDTLSAFESAFAQHPGVLGFSTLEVVARRCLHSSNDQLANASICGQAPVIALTGLPSFTEDAGTDVYTGVALDGRAVELTAEAGTEFVRGIPADLINVADLAAQNDCNELLELSDRWRAEAEFDESGTSSVFAHAAQVIANHVGCSI